MSDTTSINLHETTNRALIQWITVTGVDPDVQDVFTWSSYDIRQINEYIRSAQDFDSTGLTAFMVTRSVAHDYVKRHQFSALDLITNEKSTKERIDSLRNLIALVDDHEALAVVAEFQASLRKASQHYGVLEKTAHLIDDMNELSHVRRDALVCTNILRHHTFAKGKRSKDALKYNERVLKFWNMNSLIRAAAAQPTSGISIVLVRDPNVIEYSFFCFLIRDGENISIWTDAEKEAHPMQKFMSRSAARSRRLSDRICRLRFPYQLLDVRFDDEGKHASAVQGSDMMRTNTDAVVIADVKDLEADQILWAIMAIDSLSREGHREDLSGTGEGMHRQLGAGTTSTMAPGHLHCRALTTLEVNSEAIDEQLRRRHGFRSSGLNNWMETRYGSHVDERLYNLADSYEPLQRLNQDSDSSQDEGHPSLPPALMHLGETRVNATSFLPLSRGFRHAGSRLVDEDMSVPKLIGLDPMSFGTRQEMEDDRLWIARRNQSIALSMLAVAEFDKRRDEVTGWFINKVQSNIDFLLDAMVKGELTVETKIVRGDHGFGRVEGGVDKLLRWHRIGKGDIPDPFVRWGNSENVAAVSLFRRNKGDSPPNMNNPLRCFITGEAANVWAKFQPSSPEGIAALAGVSVSELPELLEHWNPNVPYRGNQILDRTDPLDNLIGNPWNILEFRVMIGISKREWNRRVKAHDKPGRIRFQVRSRNGQSWVYEDQCEPRRSDHPRSRR